jgi:Carboxypeptidase regulatory-like domain
MDVPINLLEWEVFLPQQYKVKEFGGDAIATNLLPPSIANVADREYSYHLNEYAMNGPVGQFEPVSLLPGQVGGVLVDQSGALVANAQVTVTQPGTGAVRNVVTDSSGRWVVSNLTSGPVEFTASAPGFQRLVYKFDYDATRPAPLGSTLQLAAATEAVTLNSSVADVREYQRIARDAKKNAQKQQTAASSNVVSLQQRISGVLPVRVDVPRAGNSYNFVRPLVLDEETKVTFTYKSK